MLKLNAEFFFGKKKVNDFLKIPTEQSTRVFFYAAEEGGGRLCLSLARQLVDIARDALETQEYNPKKLNDKYRKWKYNKGLDTDPGFMTWTMYKGLSFFRSGDRKGWVVGYSDASHGLFGTYIQNPVTMANLSEYASWYEFGVVRTKSVQPGRPWLRYSLNKLMRNNYNDTVVEEFIKPFKEAWWSEKT
jgi:hypothetical protein